MDIIISELEYNELLDCKKVIQDREIYPYYTLLNEDHTWYWIFGEKAECHLKDEILLMQKEYNEKIRFLEKEIKRLKSRTLIQRIFNE